ncbi:MAG: hypothetical protein VW491_03130 [Gammaproteobacteria bacterium]
MADVCNTARLHASLNATRFSPFKLYYRSFCGHCPPHPEVVCIPCCKGTQAEGGGKSAMIMRLKMAYKSLPLHHHTHIIKIDDDTRVNWPQLQQIIERPVFDDHLAVGGKVKDGGRYINGGAGVIAHTKLLTSMLPVWPVVDQDDVAFGQRALDMGAVFVHVPSMHQECNFDLRDVTTLHHCSAARAHLAWRVTVVVGMLHYLVV